MGFRPLLAAVVSGAVALVVPACSFSTTSSLEREGVEPFLPTTTTAASTGGGTTSTSETTVPAVRPLTNASRVSVRGIEDLQFGMTRGEAASAAGYPLEPDGAITDPSCYEVFPVGGPAGLRFTIADGTLARLDVLSGPIVTLSGAGIGTTEDTIRRLFPGQITTEPRSAGAGNRLVFQSDSPGNGQLRVIWETDGSRVLHFRAGRLPIVEPTAPCR